MLTEGLEKRERVVKYCGPDQDGQYFVEVA
jgi:hypothetical protein